MPVVLKDGQATIDVSQADMALIEAAPELYALATHPVLEWLLGEGIDRIPEPQQTSVKLFLIPLWLAATAKAERRPP